MRSVRSLALLLAALLAASSSAPAQEADAADPPAVVPGVAPPADPAPAAEVPVAGVESDAESTARVAKLGPAYDEALAHVVARCEKAGAKRMLLLVRIDESVDEVPADLVETLAATIGADLAEAGLADLVVLRLLPDANEDSAVPERPKRMIGTRELRTVAEAHEFDVLLSATYRETRGEPSLRVALFDDTRRVSVEHAELGEKQVQTAVARYGALRPRVPAGARPRVPEAGLHGASIAGAGGLRVAGGGGGVIGGAIGGGESNGPGGGERGPRGDKVQPDDPANNPLENPKGDGQKPGKGDPEPPPAGKATGLNGGVLKFAQSNMGRQVGNGECWTLANEALIAAGAQPAAGYTFGSGIDLKSVTPGDVLQFKTVRLERGNQYYTLGTPNHTAIVEASKGDVVTVLHQNFGTRTVTRDTFDFADLVSGEIRAYRPRARR